MCVAAADERDHVGLVAVHVRLAVFVVEFAADCNTHTRTSDGQRGLRNEVDPSPPFSAQLGTTRAKYRIRNLFFFPRYRLESSVKLMIDLKNSVLIGERGTNKGTGRYFSYQFGCSRPRTLISRLSYLNDI